MIYQCKCKDMRGNKATINVSAGSPEEAVANVNREYSSYLVEEINEIEVSVVESLMYMINKCQLVDLQENEHMFHGIYANK